MHFWKRFTAANLRHLFAEPVSSLIFFVPIGTLDCSAWLADLVLMNWTRPGKVRLLSWLRHRESAIISIMKPDTDGLDSKLEEEGAALAKLRGSVEENKEAGRELEKSLDDLEAATKKLADQGEGG